MFKNTMKYDLYTKFCRGVMCVVRMILGIALFMISLGCEMMPEVSDRSRVNGVYLYTVSPSKMSFNLYVTEAMKEKVAIVPDRTYLQGPLGVHLPVEVQVRPMKKGDYYTYFDLSLVNDKKLKPGKYVLRIVLKVGGKEKEYIRGFIIKNILYTPWDYIFTDA